MKNFEGHACCCFILVFYEGVNRCILAGDMMCILVSCGRAWSAHSQNAEIGHFLLHAEPYIVKDLWKRYEEGPVGEQEHEIGTPVRVLFEDGLWYLGWVTDFKTETGKYVVEFEDGDEMDLRIPDKDVEVVSKEDLEASNNLPRPDEATGGPDPDGIHLGSNAYRYQKPAADAAVHVQQQEGASSSSAPEDEETRRQKEEEAATRAAEEQKRKELAAQQRSTFVATSFRFSKKDVDRKKKSGSKSSKSGSKKSMNKKKPPPQGKPEIKKKYKFKNKSFK